MSVIIGRCTRTRHDRSAPAHSDVHREFFGNSLQAWLTAAVIDGRRLFVVLVARRAASLVSGSARSPRGPTNRRRRHGRRRHREHADVGAVRASRLSLGRCDLAVESQPR